MIRTILQPRWIIDGTGAPPLTDHAVVISGDLVTEVTPVQQLVRQDNDRVIDFPESTLIPGLVNNHVHLVLPGDNTPFVPWIDLQSDAALALMAAYNARTSLLSGVTTVRDCGGRGTIVIDVREAQSSGLIETARIVSCGWTLTITGGHTRHFGGEADGEDALRKMVRKAISQGADYIKVMASGGGTPGSLSQYPSFTLSEMRVITETAHSLGRKVSAHCIALESIVNAIEAGVDLMEHGSFYGTDLLPHFDRHVAERLAKSNIPVTPTLQVNRDLVDLLPEGPERALWERRQQTQREIVRALNELGVPLLAGSDAGWRATAFDTVWKEIDELAECGLSPVAAVRAATGAVCEALGLDDRFGTVQPGKTADLAVVDGDLSADVQRLRRVSNVFLAGNMVHSNPDAC